MLEKLRVDIVPDLLEVLKEKDFGWSAVEAASGNGDYSYGLVRLAFKDQLSEVLITIMNFFIALVIDQVEKVDLAPLRTHEKIRKIIEISFETLEPYKAVLHRLVNSSMAKCYFMTEMKMLYDIVNRIWYKAGDLSTDYNFYTKRLLLSVAYVPTFLYWLKEESTMEATMKMLDRKLQQVMKVGQLKQKIMNSKAVDFLKRKGVV
jgi:ubiquinone biosynthesis protein COQ9